MCLGVVAGYLKLEVDYVRLSALDAVGKHLHIVGIGGPGLNGMAHMLLDQGIEVTGCDLIRNTEIDALEKRGLTVAANHDLTHLKNVDALLVSAAVKEENVEIQGARQRGRQLHYRRDAGDCGRSSLRIALCHGRDKRARYVPTICFMWRPNPQVATCHLGRAI